jgi:hypothetical protein
LVKVLPFMIVSNMAETPEVGIESTEAEIIDCAYVQFIGSLRSHLVKGDSWPAAGATGPAFD